MRNNRAPKSGSEKDSLYCPFFQKIGSCMHGETCSRMHIRPQASKTLLLCNLYPNPLRFISLLPDGVLEISRSTLDRNFDEFYIDIYEELRTFGPIEDLMVASNLCDHLVGNVLVRYENLEDAVSAYSNLRCRYYAGRPIDAQYSPVEVFSGAVCRQLSLGKCQHGENCNFIHPKYPSDDVLEHCVLTKHAPMEDSTHQRHAYSSDDESSEKHASGRGQRDQRDIGRRARVQRDIERREQSERSRAATRDYDRPSSRDHERPHSKDYERSSSRDRERSLSGYERASSRDRERQRSRDYERSSGREYERSEQRERERPPSSRDYERHSRQREYDRGSQSSAREYERQRRY